jgi:hypothetical protein
MAHHISEPFHHHTHTESSSGMPSIVLPTGCGQRAVDPMSVHGVVEHPYGAKRLTVPVPAVREFRARYEDAVPDLPVGSSRRW